MTCPPRSQVDKAVRRALEHAGLWARHTKGLASGHLWARWARRWLMGIDTTAETALKAADLDDQAAGFSSAASFAAAAWSSAQTCTDRDEQISNWTECKKFVDYVLGSDAGVGGGLGGSGTGAVSP